MTSNSDADSGRRPPIGLLRGASLFLDFDGTLVDIAPSPDAVRVSSELRELLGMLRERLDGRVAILTGRSADEIERLFDPLSLTIGGHHGLETRSGGRSTTIDRPAVLDEVIAQLRPLEQQHPGVLLEEKPLGIALHFRAAPEAEEACRAAVERVAQSSGLEIQPGKMVFELKPSGADKGKALRRLMSATPFAGTLPVFLGDDLTDEPAFAAAQDMGGAGILIGDRSPSEARYGLPSVEEAVRWLVQAAGSIR